MSEEQVVIREATVDDAEAYVAYKLRNEAFLAPFEPLPGPDSFSLATARTRLQRTELACPYIALAGDEVIGQAMLANMARAAFQNATLGYSVDEQWNGRGIATRLVRHAVAEAFSEHGLHRVEAATLLDNAASQRVLEKCRFRRIGISPRHVKIAGRWQDHIVFALTLEDWTDG
jgi:ribosomal-protein-alanine N-acetyltransferase